MSVEQDAARHKLSLVYRGCLAQLIIHLLIVISSSQLVFLKKYLMLDFFSLYELICVQLSNAANFILHIPV